MTKLSVKSPLAVDISAFVPQLKMTDKQFYDFCRNNSELRIERSAEGEIIVMPPAFSDTGGQNAEITIDLGIWAREDGTGKVFDSSAGFTLPNGATRSPDVAWIRFDRWNALSPEQKASFAPISPDFVIELRSASDTLIGLQSKMQEYIDNDVRLGLLIDRKKRMVHVYRPGQDPQVLLDPKQVSCEPEIPGLAFQMAHIW
ncbi:MAG: Uma2 family endonuclease [Cyanobacteria bacterium J06560_2]